MTRDLRKELKKNKFTEIAKVMPLKNLITTRNAMNVCRLWSICDVKDVRTDRGPNIVILLNALRRRNMKDVGSVMNLKLVTSLPSLSPFTMKLI